MPEILTYSLKSPDTNSNEYYRTISRFADSWIENIMLQYSEIITGFSEYLRSIGEFEHTNEEVSFELLALGVFLRDYGNISEGSPAWSNPIFQMLITLRKTVPLTESLCKLLTGWVWGLVRIDSRKKAGENKIQSLVHWLSSCGENTKAVRFARWNDFISNNNFLSAESFLENVVSLADDFYQASLYTLGKYTKNVESYLSSIAVEHRWKYDLPLVSKSRLEYHLGMLGTEVLNKVYRQRFLSTKRKIVIVPPCMCAPEIRCKAIQTSYGASCNFCTPSCRVNQITRMGEKYEFDVFITPDDLKVFSPGGGYQNIGVIGISCALTNWNGGWETGSINLPAQGVLLDYVGCKYHWDREGFPTDVNIMKLQEVLGRKANS
jgi:uncharacterized protein